jgi:pimeloyl-ACP methyl ester carboxylesterase
MKRSLFLFACLFSGAFHCFAADPEPLVRKGYLGVKALELNDSLAKVHQVKQSTGLLVQEILPHSTVEALKVQPKDVITAVNGKPVKTFKDLDAPTKRWREGEPATITVQRGKKQLTLKGKTVGKPFETSTVAEVLYDEVPFAGGRLRSIISRPKQTGKRPAIFFIQGYTCGSIDNLGQGVYGKLVKGWNEKGYVVMRLEKPGVGDTQGTPDCDAIDLYTETKAFEAGYQKLKQYDFVDTANLFIFGHSMGGVIAPLIAEKHAPKGVMVYGTVFTPWFEFLLGMYRFQNPKTGIDFVENEETVRGLQKVFYQFFVEKKSPREIAMDPALTKIVEKELEYKGTDVMWTRHYKFWQQLDEINLAQSWKATPSHVLAIWGEYDFESYDKLEHTAIVDLVNSYRPGKATYLEMPATNHLFVKVPSVEEGQRITQRRDAAYQDKNFNYDLIAETDRWMQERAGK